MSRNSCSFFLSILFLIQFLGLPVFSQTIPAGFPVLEELARRKNLLGLDSMDYSFSLRPVRLGEWAAWDISTLDEKGDSLILDQNLPKKKEIRILPVLNTVLFNSNRPFGWGNSSLVNGAGFQSLTSPGVFLKFHFLEIQLRPEFILSQNNRCQGFTGEFSDEINFSRFRYWNFGDHPEYFGESFNRFSTFGQSYASLHFGKIEMGVGTQNLWWGPGQFSGLIFTNNARGIPHAFLRTSAPVNIGLGKLEGQIIVGKAEDSGLSPTQNDALNNQYFLKFSGDRRYINGISLTFQPKFLKNIFVGFNRTFQQYESQVQNTFEGRFPIFEAFQKERFFENGNTVLYDDIAQDQQVSVFFKYRGIKGKFEVYAEYGKHDHSLNWREFILNPEHARAYLMGFSKLFALSKGQEFIQIRGEIIQQSESINRYIRYPELGVSNTSWHTHYQVRGFTNFGESMGSGIGVGSNAQIFEISKVRGANKIGLILKRIENNKDFYMRAADLDPSIKPWVDFSSGIVWDQKINNLIISTNALLINGVNYQWKSNPGSIIGFNSRNNLRTFSGGVHLIYFFSGK